MYLKVIEISTGKILCSVPVYLTGLDHTPALNEYRDEAWKAAVEDKLVDPLHRENYEIISG